MNRRDLLKLGAASTVATSLPQIAPAEDRQDFETEQRSQSSILQGATDSSRTQFSVVAKKGMISTFTAKNSQGDVIFPDSVAELNHPDLETLIYKVKFSGLQLNEDYQLNILDPSLEIIDQRDFKMLDTSKKDLRFAICSCMKAKRHRSAIWKDLVAQSPDMIFFVGDAVYADRDGVAGEEGSKRLWRQFSENRAILDIYFSQKLIPILATWDDHDFGQNNGGITYPYVQEAQRNFTQFFAQDENHCESLESGPGVSQAMILGGQQFLFLDCRSFRQPNGSDDRWGHWGETQETWMHQKIRDFEGPTFLINGSQFFPRFIRKESLSRNHVENYKAFIKEISQMSQRVILISGDVHYSEISRIQDFGYTTYEITSSSMHSKGAPGAPFIVA
ncbi:MAG: hypothetical protein AAF203_10320, partial [Pseudomonadota bacterium]